MTVHSQNLPSPFRKAGFTLIEVAFSLAIFSIGLIAVGTMGVTTLRCNMSSRNLSTAVMLAQNKLDELRSDPDSTVFESGLNPAGETGAGFFDRTVTLAPGPVPDTTRIDVTVSWKEPAETSITLTSIIADP